MDARSPFRTDFEQRSGRLLREHRSAIKQTRRVLRHCDGCEYLGHAVQVSRVVAEAGFRAYDVVAHRVYRDCQVLHLIVVPTRIWQNRERLDCLRRSVGCLDEPFFIVPLGAFDHSTAATLLSEYFGTPATQRLAG